MLALVSLLLGVAFSAEKVNLDLYFEALCPYCTQYQQGTLRFFISYILFIILCMHAKQKHIT